MGEMAACIIGWANLFRFDEALAQEPGVAWMIGLFGYLDSWFSNFRSIFEIFDAKATVLPPAFTQRNMASCRMVEHSKFQLKNAQLVHV
jgi:hypothetical protein